MVDLESLGVLLLQGGQPRGDLVTGKLVDGVDRLAPVDGQAAQGGAYLFRVDCSGVLVRILCAARQLIQALKLADQGDAIAALALFPKLLDIGNDMGLVAPIQKLGRVVVGSVRSVPRFARSEERR